LYRKLHQSRGLKRSANKGLVTRPGTPVGLSQGQSKNLSRSLYVDLHQPHRPKPDLALTGPAAPRQPAPAQAVPASGETVRQVALLPGEHVTHSFSPESGLLPQPQESGRMLVLTNQRVMTFGRRNGMRETVLMPLDQIKTVAVNSGRRGMGTLVQGGLMVGAAALFYVMLTYWLTGRVDGPTVPIIRMDLVAFLIFLAILSGVGLIAQVYFGKPDGNVVFQGEGASITFPFSGDGAEEQVYQVVNATFAARQSAVDDPHPVSN